VDGKPGKDGTGANPSVVTDGKHVFAYFKSGDFGGFTVDGQPLWHHNLQDMYGEDTLWWDLGTSPVLTENAVVIACMHSGPSYLAAFKKDTGELLWKHDRELGAPEEAAQSYATPVVVTEDGSETIVVLGADHVTAHDAATGAETWRLGGLNPTAHKYFRSIASAAVSEGIVVAPYARGDSLTAVRMGGKGDVTKTHVLWSNTGTSADVPTPAIADGRIYNCRDNGENRGVVDCLDLLTGKTICLELSQGATIEEMKLAVDEAFVMSRARRLIKDVVLRYNVVRTSVQSPRSHSCPPYICRNLSASFMLTSCSSSSRFMC
jgi:outer membrane protein assembly factor BamB